MALVTVGAVAVAFTFLILRHGLVSIHLYIAVALGIGMAIMLAAALMGLVFLSNGTGHDAAVDDRLDRQAADDHGVES